MRSVTEHKLTSYPRLTHISCSHSGDGFHFGFEQVWGQCVKGYYIEWFLCRAIHRWVKFKLSVYGEAGKWSTNKDDFNS